MDRDLHAVVGSRGDVSAAGVTGRRGATPVTSEASHVIGTAGHIDHGKSSLVLALTGTDPDRLAEEKRRGMTIELGFAAWPLPSGRTVGVVDVPGHRRFVRTMVAGAQGIDLVVLVVAATEGVMPQTREHLTICELLGIRRAIVALTKIDVTDADTLALARAEVDELLAPTPYAGAPVVACSAVTGAGLDVLASAVDSALAAAPPRPDRGVPRLYVDRVFSMPGFGPVVTGTLDNGALTSGTDLLVLPSGHRARVRGLQRHGADLARAEPGGRTAVNLGGIERAELHRGDAIVQRGTIAAVSRLDGWIVASGDSRAGLRHREHLELHLGTTEVPATLWLLEGSELAPGTCGFGQIRMDTAVAALPGDRFVLRRAAETATVGGGVVLGIAPRRHRRRDQAVAGALMRRRDGGDAGVLLEELRAARLGMELTDMVARTGVGGASLTALLADAGSTVAAVGRRWFATERWHDLHQAAVSAVDAHHRESPLQPGMPRDELGQRLRLGRASGTVVDGLVASGALEERHGALAVPDRGEPPALRDRPEVAAVLALLRERGLDAPDTEQLRSAGLTVELQRLMVREGLLVRASDGLLLAADTYAEARRAVVAHLREHGEATVAALRDRLNATRRVVVPLLERLDTDRVTVRHGDLRRLSAARRGD